jgi:Skp family chaperone for outer membrane proteins
MKTIIVTLTLILFSFVMQEMQAQNDSIPSSSKDSISIKSEFLAKQRQKIIDQEKEGLKNDLETIQFKLDNKLIKQEDAVKLKKEAAEKRALNIENRIEILENKTALEERNNASYGNFIELLGSGKIVNISMDFDSEKERIYDRRTTSDLVLAAGFNNAISD